MIFYVLKHEQKKSKILPSDNFTLLIYDLFIGFDLFDTVRNLIRNLTKETPIELEVY